jgi:hypothetical protein
MENNILIAKFEGLEVTTDGISDLYYDENGGLNRIKDYRNDWGALMDVVEKIDEVSNDSTLFKIEYNRAFIEDTENYNILIDVMANSRREATYKAVVEFIKQYNKTK